MNRTVFRSPSQICSSCSCKAGRVIEKAGYGLYFGPGKFRGGNGIFRQFELEADVSLYLWFERSVTPGWGLFGGKSGAVPDVIINPGRADERHMLKCNGVALKSGDTVLMHKGGGGGYGLAHEREPKRVQADVKNGFVTRESADRNYGVVLRDDLHLTIGMRLFV